MIKGPQDIRLQRQRSRRRKYNSKWWSIGLEGRGIGENGRHRRVLKVLYIHARRRQVDSNLPEATNVSLHIAAPSIQSDEGATCREMAR
jgi:hypothetical protein